MVGADPDTAYRYAKGLPVVHPFHRARVQIRTPLDLLVVADHAEYLGVMRHVVERGIPREGLGIVARTRAWLAERWIRWVVERDEGMVDRVQVVKGWVDAEAQPHERVYDALWSDGRQPDAQGRVPAVGNTVDPETARYTNEIGSPVLAGVWEDPDFDPALEAFYYVRVLEIPTPRHSTFDAVALGLDPREVEEGWWLQERAYTSPIWYRP